MGPFPLKRNPGEHGIRLEGRCRGRYPQTPSRLGIRRPDERKVAISLICPPHRFGRFGRSERIVGLSGQSLLIFRWC
jgi:hypothetical protein